MDCEQLSAFYKDYAFGALEGKERAELEAHLARACPQCTPGIARALRETLASSPGVPSQVAASSHGALQPRKPAFPAWAWILAVLLALMTGYAVRQMSVMTAQLIELRKQMRTAQLQNLALQAQLELNREVASVTIDPASKPVLLTAKDPNLPSIHAYFNAKLGVAFTADGMASLPASRTLQLWAFPKKGMPVSVALFRPDAQGQVVMFAPVRLGAEEIAKLAVSDEPAGGSPQPTTMPAWVAALK